MSTISYVITVASAASPGNGTIRIPGHEVQMHGYDVPNCDAVFRAILDKYQASATTTGTVTLTAA